MSLQDESLQFDDEEIWIQLPHFSSTNPLHLGLKDLDRSLRCPICPNLFKVPVSVQPCGHTFCSECIRNCFKAGLTSLKRKALCPVCRHPVDTKGVEFSRCLQPNPSLQVAVECFRSVRQRLHHALLAEKTALETTDASPNQMENNFSAPDATSNGFLGKVATSTERRPTKCRAAYHAKKKKHLQALCASEGLSTSGNDQALKIRHEQYITFFNSECDSLQPKTQQECVAEIHRREKAQSLEEKKARSLGALQHSKLLSNKSKNEGGTTGNAKFDAQFSAGFEQLIAQVQERQNKSQEGKYLSEAQERTESSNDPGESLPTSQDGLELCRPSASKTRKQDQTSSMKKGPGKAPASVSSIVSTIHDRSGRRSAHPRSDEKDVEATVLTSPICGAASDPILYEGCELMPLSTHKRRKRDHAGGIAENSNSSPPKRKSFRTSLVGKWACPSCTFFNTVCVGSLALCEMCAAARPIPQADKSY